MYYTIYYYITQNSFCDVIHYSLINAIAFMLNRRRSTLHLSALYHTCVLNKIIILIVKSKQTCNICHIMFQNYSTDASGTKNAIKFLNQTLRIT